MYHPWKSEMLCLYCFICPEVFSIKVCWSSKFQEWTFSKIIPFLVCFLTSIPQNYPVGIHSAVLQTTLIGPTAAISIDSAEGHRESLPLKPSWLTRVTPPVCLILLPQGLASHAYAADTWASLFKRRWSTFFSRNEITAWYWCALPRCWKAEHLHFSGTYKLQPHSVRWWRISSPLLSSPSSPPPRFSSHNPLGTVHTPTQQASVMTRKSPNPYYQRH